MVSIKSTVTGEDAGHVVALPAQSVVTTARVHMVVVAYDVRVFEKRVMP